jgi:disulfide bond formation protein DsbB
VKLLIRKPWQEADASRKRRITVLTTTSIVPSTDIAPKATLEPNPFLAVIGYGLLTLSTGAVLSLVAAICFGEDPLGFGDVAFFAPFWFWGIFPMHGLYLVTHYPSVDAAVILKSYLLSSPKEADSEEFSSDISNYWRPSVSQRTSALLRDFTPLTSDEKMTYQKCVHAVLMFYGVFVFALVVWWIAANPAGASIMMRLAEPFCEESERRNNPERGSSPLRREKNPRVSHHLEVMLGGRHKQNCTVDQATAQCVFCYASVTSWQ